MHPHQQAKKTLKQPHASTPTSKRKPQTTTFIHTNKQTTTCIHTTKQKQNPKQPHAYTNKDAKNSNNHMHPHQQAKKNSNNHIHPPQQAKKPQTSTCIRTNYLVNYYYIFIYKMNTLIKSIFNYCIYILVYTVLVDYMIKY